MPQLFDMHCHLDFAENAEAVARDAGGSLEAVCSTVAPSAFLAARKRLAASPGIRVALGMHPWRVADGRAGDGEAGLFEELVGECRIVGEVGLDFHGRRKGSEARQTQALARALGAVRSCGGGRLVFLHAVKSCGRVLDLLEEHGTLDGCACVFHWFSGTRSDFERAVSRGCLFSVNSRMLSTKAGASFAKAVPDERLLLETDGPSREGATWSAEAWLDALKGAAQRLADVRGAEFEEVLELAARNSRLLLDEYGNQGRACPQDRLP